MSRPRELLVFILVATALGAGAAPASALNARVTDRTLRVTAAAGEANDVFIVPGDSALLVSDLGMPPATGDGCEAGDIAATCTGADAVVLALADADDVASLDTAVTLPATIDGGDGSDSLSAGGGATLMHGGRGDDFLSGGDAADSVDAGPGVDYVISAGGNDTIAARDGEADSIACGDGTDTVNADPDDSVDTDCERVSRTGATPAVTPPPGGAGGGAVADDGPVAGAPATARRSERTACAPKGRFVSCAVRLRDPELAGRFDVTLKRGPVLFARGHGKVVGGSFRVRMRIRGRLVNGSYKLRATVRPDGAKPFRRMWYVGVLVIGRSGAL